MFDTSFRGGRGDYQASRGSRGRTRDQGPPGKYDEFKEATAGMAHDIHRNIRSDQILNLERVIISYFREKTMVFCPLQTENRLLIKTHYLYTSL